MLWHSGFAGKCRAETKHSRVHPKNIEKTERRKIASAIFIERGNQCDRARRYATHQQPVDLVVRNNIRIE